MVLLNYDIFTRNNLAFLDVHQAMDSFDFDAQTDFVECSIKTGKSMT